MILSADLCQRPLVLLSNIVNPRKLRAPGELNSRGFGVQSIKSK